MANHFLKQLGTVVYIKILLNRSKVVLTPNQVLQHSAAGLSGGVWGLWACLCSKT